jgi:hypothetical protein
VIFPFIDIPYNRVNLYQKPVPSGWGEKKLTAICRAELKRDPKINELFLFYNHTRDVLRIFWRDRTGSQEVSRVLPRGSFILPASQPGEAFLKIERKKLESLFRIPKHASSRSRVPALPPESLPSRDGVFIEIDPSLLPALLEPVRSAAPKRSSLASKMEKSGIATGNVLRLPHCGGSGARPGKRKK